MSSIHMKLWEPAVVHNDSKVRHILYKTVATTMMF